MNKSLTYIPTLFFLFVLIVLINTPYDRTVALVIPTSTGTQGQCLDSLRGRYQEDMARIDRMEKAEVGGLNDSRQDLIDWLEDAWENEPDLETTLNLVLIWLGALLEDVTLSSLKALINAYYDGEVDKAQGNHNHSRRNLDRNTRADIRYCQTLPTTFPEQNDDDEEDDHNEDGDENERENAMDRALELIDGLFEDDIDNDPGELNDLLDDLARLEEGEED